MSPRTEKIGKRVVLGFCGLVLLCCAGDFFAFVETGIATVAPLPFGWAPYIYTATRQIHVNLLAISMTAVYLVALICGSHLFLRWFFGETRPAHAESPHVSTPWRMGWTIRIFALILLSFLPAMALIGITHQTIWLARSPDSIYKKRTGAASVKCAANLHNIGIALLTYANNYDGHYPDDLEILAEKEELGPAILVCPGTADEPPQTIKELFKSGRCSYIYLGRGLMRPIEPKKVVVIERPENHEQMGIHALNAAGDVEWLKLPEQESEILKLGFERVKPATSKGPDSSRHDASPNIVAPETRP